MTYYFFNAETEIEEIYKNVTLMDFIIICQSWVLR